jgi:L-ascorbate metabolism protein UlaG (beta-lactamase superfamily)
MHFQTFPFLEQDTENFEKEIKRRKIKVDIIVLSPGGETVL